MQSAASSALMGEIIPAPLRKMPSFARRALRVRAEAFVADFEAAGATLSLTSAQPATIWIGVPVPPFFGRRPPDYERINRLKALLERRRAALYPYILAILHERYDGSFATAIPERFPSFPQIDPGGVVRVEDRKPTAAAERAASFLQAAE